MLVLLSFSLASSGCPLHWLHENVCESLRVRRRGEGSIVYGRHRSSSYVHIHF